MMKKKGIACMLACTIIFNSVWQESSLVFAQEISFQDEEGEIENLDTDITDELVSEPLDNEGELDDIESDEWVLDSDFSDLTEEEDINQTEGEFGDGEKDSAWLAQTDIAGNSEIITDEKSGILFKKKSDSDVEAIEWKNAENNKDILEKKEKI